MLVLCPFPRDTAAGQRLKYEPYFDDWRAQGWDIDVSPFCDRQLWRVLYQPGGIGAKVLGTVRGYARRLADLGRLRRYDLVYVYLWVTPLGPALFERLVLRLARAVVYDLEDNIVAGQEPRADNHPNPLVRWLKGAGKARVMVARADAVIVASPYLVGPARARNLARQVRCIPPSLDTDRICPVSCARAPGARVVIGWTGTFSSRIYLDDIAGALRALARRVPFTLRVIGNFDYAIDGVVCEVVRWSAAHEARDLQSLDIGIYPLRDDVWTRGKAGLKIIQYQAAGLPCVASHVPLSAVQLRDGESGFLVRDHAEWVDRLERLVRDADLRRRMGAAGRADAVALYSRSAIAPAYRAVLDLVATADA